MKVTLVPIGDVLPYAGNPRRNAAAVAKVAASLKEFGWRQPIVVDEHRVVIAGHTRLLAAKQLGMAKVPMHMAEGLTPAQVKAYRLADNRSAQEAEWDDNLLASELRALEESGYDLALTGFDEGELRRLLSDTAEAMDQQEVPAVPVSPRSQLGDLIRIGPHTLVCGDATDAQVVARAMAGEQARCVWTDPPYGVDYVGKTKRALKIENDESDEGKLERLLRAAFGAALAVSDEGAPWYVSGPSRPTGRVFANVLFELGIYRQTLMWLKQTLVLGRSDYHYRHEPIWYGWAPGGAHPWHSDRTQTSVLEFDRPTRSEEHPTMKPVALVAYCLGNSTQPGDHVLDPFMGSGTTLLACESGGRIAHGVELDPRYCDVIVNRWEQATGLTAERPKHAKRRPA